MNKSYRSVFNQATGAWVAVSELTAARGKRSGGLGTLVVAAGLSVLAPSGIAQVTYNNGDNLAGAIDTTPSNITLQSNDAGTATQSGVISGPNGIIKTGAGVIVLGAANTYQGSTAINAGALQVSTDANLGNGGGIVLDGGTLRIGADNFASGRAVTLGATGGTVDVAGTAGNQLTGQITGGTLTLRNTGVNALGDETRRLTIDNAANNYTGGTVLQGNGVAGRLNVWTTTAGSLGSGPVTILENAELRFQDATASAGNLVITVPVGVNTNINGSNSGLQFQNGANAGTATITTNGAGSYVLFGGGGASAQQATLNNNGGRLIFQETSTGGAATINNNSGTLQMGNTADLSGATVINSGEVYVSDTTAPAAAIGSLSGSGNVVLGNATLQVGALGKNDVISGVISNTGPGSADQNGGFYINPVMLGNGAVIKVGAGTLTLTGDNTYTNGTTISGGALQLGNGGTTGSVVGNIAVGSGASLIVNRSDNIVLTNPISGNGALVQAGPGTTTINTVNAYTGGTTLNAGGLTVTTVGALGAGPVTINGGTFGTQAQLNNPVVVNNSFSVAPVGQSTWTGPVTLNANATLTHVAPLGSIVFAGSIGGAGGITLTGVGGNWSGYTYNAANNYGGTTTVQGNASLTLAGAGNVPADLVVSGSGSVLANGSNRFSPTATVTVNSTGNLVAGQVLSGLELVNGTQSIGQLNGNGTVGLNGSQLTVGAGSFGGVMSNGSFSAGPPPGAGSLVKDGPGTLTLSGANTYTGSTTVAGGTLRAGAANTLSAASAHSVAAGATLDLAGFSQSMASLNNSGTVSLVGAAAGTTLTVTGPYVGNNGTLRLGTVLGTSGPSDRLVLDGPTAIASGNTTVQITNLGGLGGQTAGNGIEVITALNGATTTAQTTKNAFALGGAGHVDAGAFEYRLYAADAGGAGENWYLRSQVIPPPPP
ncbi:beta strand repeat-containing protein, partial [Variovorax sp. JS1663]|uniref:beta strand repeat-containing protein n=1 Tax=Variovorax sp. JS1663 TaxID=1851577 RepID=UPI0018643BB4